MYFVQCHETGYWSTGMGPFSVYESGDPEAGFEVLSESDGETVKFQATEDEAAFFEHADAVEVATAFNNVVGKGPVWGVPDLDEVEDGEPDTDNTAVWEITRDGETVVKLSEARMEDLALFLDVVGFNP